jgi:hypothetical protein
VRTFGCVDRVSSVQIDCFQYTDIGSRDFAGNGLAERQGEGGG